MQREAFFYVVLIVFVLNLFFVSAKEIDFKSNYYSIPPGQGTFSFSVPENEQQQRIIVDSLDKLKSSGEINNFIQAGERYTLFFTKTDEPLRISLDAKEGIKVQKASSSYIVEFKRKAKVREGDRSILRAKAQRIIEDARDHGHSDQEIKEGFLKKGWSEKEIDELLRR